MKTNSRVVLFALICFARGVLGQDIVQITFDGPPQQPPGTSFTVTNYYEAGMSFRPVSGSGSFSRVGPPTDPRDPNNGTAFLRTALGQSLKFSFTNGSTFDLVSVDLAGYSSVVPDGTVNFVGYRPDNSAVQTNVSVSGIVFQTCDFGPDFTGLIRVEIPNFGWSLDNLVIKPVPIIPPPSALSIEQVWSSSIQQQPRLQVRLLWPTNFTGHQLLSNTNLASTNWVVVSPPPVIVGTNNVVTNDFVGPRRFYRLSAP